MKLFIICFLFLSSCFGLAQQGTVRYNRTYYWHSSNAPNAQNILYFNAEASLYRQPEIVLDMSKRELPEMDNKQEFQARQPLRTHIIDTSGKSNLYYRELVSNKVFCRTDAKINSKKFETYLYEDKGAGELNWKLKDEYKNISGFDCQKASIFFRGRNYDAWFTTEIPLPFGPWKFGGLPGLILEVYDDTKEISFTAENITIPDSDAGRFIILPKGIAIAHSNFVSQRDAAIQKRINAVRSRIIPKGAISLKSTKTKNAIELEYEWNQE